MPNKNLSADDQSLLGHIALLEYCGISNISQIRSQLRKRLGSKIKDKKAASVAIRQGLASSGQKASDIMHGRVLSRIAEDTNLPLNFVTDLGKFERIKWVDFVINPSYRATVTNKYLRGDFVSCMYIRQCGHVANELLNNYKRTLSAYTAETTA